jgi:hypothetical protein
MLTTETLDKAICLFEEGSTYFCITTGTALTREEAEAVGRTYDARETEQLYREIVLAGILEHAAAKLRSGEGWEEGTIDDVFREIRHVYPPCVHFPATADSYDAPN